MNSSVPNKTDLLHCYNTLYEELTVEFELTPILFKIMNNLKIYSMVPIYKKKLHKTCYIFRTSKNLNNLINI